MLHERVRATEHASRDPFRVIERRHGLAEVVDRGAVVHRLRRASDGVAAERDGVGLPEDDAYGLPAGVNAAMASRGVPFRRRGANINVHVHTHISYC